MTVETIKTSHFGVVFVGTCEHCGYKTQHESWRIDAATELTKHKKQCLGETHE